MIFDEVKKVIASALKISENTVTMDLGYQQIFQWDSLNHIQLMLALEQSFNVKIDEETVLDLISVANICTFLGNKKDPTVKYNLHEQAQNQVRIEEVHRGLNGIFYDYSSICLIDGINGKLYYQGHSIEELVERYSFEEIIGLLILGEFPDAEKLNFIKSKLYQMPQLPEQIITIIKGSKDFKPIHIIKLVISYYSGIHSDDSDEDLSEVALKILNLMPLIIGQHNFFRHGINKIAHMNPDWSYAKNVLYLLTLKEPNDKVVNYFDKDLILHAEHDSNASTFVARICASTKSDPLSALTAAIAAFSGDLHGGALEKVAQMIAEIGTPEHVEAYIHNRLENKLPVYGYGHRIYRTWDPRARYMDKVAKQLSIDNKDMKDYEILHLINEYMKPYSEHGVSPNVDFYDAVIYKLLNIREDLFLPAFIISRVVGWFAHMREQYTNNILIRPKLKYKGLINEA